MKRLKAPRDFLLHCTNLEDLPSPSCPAAHVLSMYLCDLHAWWLSRMIYFPLERSADNVTESKECDWAPASPRNIGSPGHSNLKLLPFASRSVMSTDRPRVGLSKSGLHFCCLLSFSFLGHRDHPGPGPSRLNVLGWWPSTQRCGVFEGLQRCAGLSEKWNAQVLVTSGSWLPNYPSC